MKTDDTVQALVIAARGAALQLDGEIFSVKQSLREGDGNGGVRPFDLQKISRDDRLWVELLERKFDALNSALAAFDAAIPNPASL